MLDHLYLLLKGNKLKISHFKLFGYKCFIRNNDRENLRKLMQGVEGIFVVYSQQRKTYIVHNNRTKVVKEITLDVFNEKNDGKASSASFEDLRLKNI